MRKSLELGEYANIDFSRASIPTILIALIVYSVIRLTIEFMMQPRKVRRWKLAQKNYRLSLNLIRFALLVLAVTYVDRSVNSIVSVVIGACLIFVSYFILVALLAVVLTSLLHWYKSRKRHSSVASRAFEGFAYSTLIVGGGSAIGLITNGTGLLTRLPFGSMIPAEFSTLIFSVMALVVLVSFPVEANYSDKLFAKQSESDLEIKEGRA